MVSGRSVLRLATLLACVFASHSAFRIDLSAQTPAPRPDLNGKGLVLGRVVDSETGAGLGGFVVAVRSGSSLSSLDTLRTTPDGSFVARNLPAGTWSFGATGPGYEGSGGTQRSIVVSLKDAEKRGDVIVPLRKFGSISGAVYDEDGEPVSGVLVKLLTGQPGALSGSNATTTDDRGRYQFTSLRPREYAVAVSSVHATASAETLDAMQAEAENGKSSGNLQGDYGTLFPGLRNGHPGAVEIGGTLLATNRVSRLPRRTSNGRAVMYPMQFYPAATASHSAKMFSLHSGQELTGIDFQIRPVPSAAITGVVTAPDSADRRVLLRLQRLDMRSLTPDFDVATTICDGQGRFSMPFVTPGQYVLRVSRRIGPTADKYYASTTDTPQDDVLWATIPLTIGERGIADLAVDLRRGFHVSGSVSSTTPLPPDVLERMTVSLFFADGRGSLAAMTKVDASGKFMTSGIPAGSYSIRIGGGLGAWSLSTATIDGRDIADAAVDITGNITLSIAMNEIVSDVHGTVRTADGQPQQLVQVAVFTTDRRQWNGYGGTPRRIKQVRTAFSGTYTVPALPPGEYFVAVADDDLGPDWLLPDNLAKMAATAKRVTIAENEKRSLDLVFADRKAGLFQDDEPAPHGPYVPDQDAALSHTPTRVVGTVVDEGTGQPIASAAVTINAAGLRGRATVTDERGVFHFDDATPARVIVAASKAGYLPMEYGARQTGRPGTPVPVVAGATASIAIRLSRTGVVSGRVVNEEGQPLPTVAVRVMTVRLAANGGSELFPVPGVIESRADMSGNYRIHGLPPGEYYISAVPDYAGAGFGARQVTDDEVRWARQQLAGASASVDPFTRTEPARGSSVIYGATLYPSARTAGTATPVKIAAGEERIGLDIRVPLVPSVKVSTLALTPDGAKAAGVLVKLTLADRTSVAPPPNGSGAERTTPDGRAVFTEVTPGRYDLTAIVTPPTQPGSAPVGLWAQTTVVITDRDQDVTIGLQLPLSITGRVLVDGASPPPLSSLRVALNNPAATAATSTAPSPIDADGRFTISGVTPGDYRVTVAGLPSSWSPRSAMAGNADLMDALLAVNSEKSPEILVTLTDRPSELSGTFVNSDGRPATEYSVVMIATDSQYWARGSRRVRAVRPDLDGRFVFANLPPGEYGLCPFTDFEPDDLADPEFLRRVLPQAIRVTISAGEKKTQDLRLSGGG